MHHHHIYQAQKDIFALISFGIVTNWLGLQSHRNIFLPFLGHLFLFTLMTFRLQTIIRLVEILINCLRLSGKKTEGRKCFFLQRFLSIRKHKESLFAIYLFHKIFKCFKIQKGKIYRQKWLRK